jgi:hypothetical protein
VNKPFNLQVPEYDANMFSWKDGVGVCEVSDIAPHGTLYTQCWNDSCDLGMRLHNPKTGNLVEFVLNDIRRDGGGDLISWHFKSIDEMYSDLQLIIFND